LSLARSSPWTAAGWRARFGSFDMTTRVGLIVNPIAGIGGRVGLKGSDGLEVQQRARELGAVSTSLDRAVQALRRLAPLKDKIDLVTFPSEMGESAARACGFHPTVIGSIHPGETTGQDTQNAACMMREMSVVLILFAGGDGTARDMCAAIGTTLPVLGIPAGVKIHSAVYAITPAAAGELANAYLQTRVATLCEAEVMDVDEAAYRQEIVSPRLFGYMQIPFIQHLIQGRKSPSPVGEQAALESIALAVIEQMQADRLYIVGPGTTTRPILTRLGLPKTLIGVDVVLDKQLIAADANEASLLRLLSSYPATIVVTPIGGQGYLLGRGNQQISPDVIRQTGAKNILVVSTLHKIHTLSGRPFLVDTGDAQVDQLLVGYIQVVTGYDERVIYKVAGAVSVTTIDDIVGEPPARQPSPDGGA